MNGPILTIVKKSWAGSTGLPGLNSFAKFNGPSIIASPLKIADCCSCGLIQIPAAKAGI
jgi:hypothetical protein